MTILSHKRKTDLAANLKQWRKANKDKYNAQQYRKRLRRKQEKDLWRALDEMAQHSNISKLVLFDLE